MLSPRDMRAARTMLILATIASAVLAWPLGAGAGGFSLRFFGNGLGAPGLDRVVVPLDGPARPVDVGGDFTVEFWMKAQPGENASDGCVAGNDNWIYGNIMFDRDVYGDGDHGDWGISLRGGRIAFGVHNGNTGDGLCGGTDLADGVWHHVAVTREAASGRLRLFVDGRLDGEAEGPPGDVSYRDGRVGYPADPTLVIGAEKHDAGAAYPSYSGWLDEVRVSNAVRYAGPFTPPVAPFVPDAATVALYHLDEGAGDVAGDSSGAPGGPSQGIRRYGGTPAGPEWSPDTPFAGSSTLALAANRDRVAPGDLLRLSATVVNAAAEGVADVYLGALLPVDAGLGVCPGNGAHRDAERLGHGL